MPFWRNVARRTPRLARPARRARPLAGMTRATAPAVATVAGVRPTGTGARPMAAAANAGGSVGQVTQV